MAGVFVVGAAVGLVAALWLDEDSVASQPAISAVPSSQVQDASPLPGASTARPPVVRGISPSELPYDGAPPPVAEEPASPPDAPTAAVREPPATSSGTSTIEGAGERDAGPGNEGVANATAASAPQPVKSEASPAKIATKPASVTGPDEESKSAKAKQGGVNAVDAAPKRKVPRTDREIERIRRQVDEELKKKTEHGRASGDGRPGARQGAKSTGSAKDDRGGGVSRVSAIRASLAKCDRKTNFIGREFCRWQVCNGSWGKNGCPSYQQQASTY